MRSGTGLDMQTQPYGQSARMSNGPHMPQNLDAALAFLAKFPDAKLFPARWGFSKKQNCKTHCPLVAWGTESSSDPEQIRTWLEPDESIYACVALSQSNHSVLDVDNKKGKDGSKRLMDLELENEDLPATLVASTPSGDGRHYHFTGSCALGANKFGLGLDSAVMVPVPGSHAVGKGEYKIIKDAPAAPIPEWLKRLAGERIQKEERTIESAVELDLPHNIAAATAYLLNAPEAIEGDGGDATAYKVVCRVRDFGISREMASELVHEHYADRCSPYEYDWLESKIENAYQYAAKDLGTATAEAAFAEIEAVQVENDDDWPRSAGSYEGTPPETEWIVDGWIPKGDAVLFTGEGGIGKSLMMMQLEAHVAAGRTFLGNIVEQCKVLHVLCEDDDREIHRRYDRIKRSSEFAFTPDDVARMGSELQFWSRVGKDAVMCAAEGNLVHTKPFFDKLKRAIDRMGYGHKLLVLDTLADVFAGNENDRSQVNQFVKNYIMQLARNHDCTPVIIGHPPKSGAEYSGSTAWNGAVRSRMYMAPHEKKTLAEEYRVLHLPKSNRGKSGLKITVKYDRGVFTFVNEVEVVDAAEEHNLNMVLDAIITHADNRTPIGLANTSKVKTKDLTIKGHNGENLEPGEIRRLIRILIDKGDAYEKTGTKYENGVWPMGGN